MEIVNFLAQWWGFSLLIISLSFLINPKHIHKVFRFMENEAVIILSGITGVLLGVALILTYNVWESNWKAIITIFGWVILIKGIIRLFFPGFVLKVWARIKNRTEWIPFLFLIMILFGCFLIYMGFLA